MSVLSNVVRVSIAASALLLAGASGTSKPAQQQQQPGPYQPYGGGQPAAGGYGTQPAGGNGGFGGGGGGGGGGAVSSAQWDIAVNVSPSEVKVTEDGSMWKASNLEVGDSSKGVYSVMVIRDPSVTDPWAFAQTLKDDAAQNGANTSDIAQQDFVGMRGARYISAYSDSGVATLTVVAVSGQCVYVLLATRNGNQDEVVEFFNWALGIVRTASGGPANAPMCR